MIHESPVTFLGQSATFLAWFRLTLPTLWTHIIRLIARLATWTTSDASVVTVSTSGVVTGVASGAAVVTATYSSVAGSFAVAES